MAPTPPSTGLASLDSVLRGLRPGDNVVWQVDAIDDYAALVRPFVEAAIADGRRLAYFRFARHAPLVEDERGVDLHRLNPAIGFESFTASIHQVVERSGPGTFYVFDCLSDLAADWYSDLMLGNFFTVTCPYLYELDTVTYFALLRGSHSHEAVDAIRNTTQLLVDVFRHRDELHVHPLKVDGRRSLTMYLPHVRRGDSFLPLTDSATLSEVLADLSSRRGDAVARLDVWDRKFMHAREVLDDSASGARSGGEARSVFRALLPMVLTRDERLTDLAARHLDLADLLTVRGRMIGTGLVGGKALGMLLARAVLTHADPRWATVLERHDSWFIGSDVFYTYLVRNGCWRARHEQRSGGAFLDAAAEARDRILSGTFPEFIEQQLVAMLEYYGQSPIIVRSSSLLEDGFGNAFTGKYESVFCPNQGSPRERLRTLLDAIRRVYASTMSDEALLYRSDRGLLDRDEQMAILVQRVSGELHGKLFYPQLAGVALSYNPYVWSKEIDPRAGVMRVVCGLGTRAVERADDDYTRIVALNAPSRRPEATAEKVTEHAQRRVDVLDLEANRLASASLDDVVRDSTHLPLDLFVAPRRGAGYVLTFEKLLSETPFVELIRSLLKALESAYRYPVDVEFTANFVHGDLRIDVVQCRPLQVKEGGVHEPPPADVAEEAVVLASHGPVIGPSSNARIDRIVYVDPDAYGLLGSQDRYEVARVVGRLVRRPGERRSILLLGPGRWGTSTASLGVPVAFAEIRGVSALCEIVRPDSGVVPDVSLGSHFFNDLVESNMLYLALHPALAGHRLDEGRLRTANNRLAELLPDDARMAAIIHVVDFPSAEDGRELWLNANCVDQEVLCYLAAAAAKCR
jgi:pyruvate,water dikinase